MSDDERSAWKDEKGRFTLGNRWWEARSSFGRKPKFESPEQLLAACMEYVAWAEANPLWEAKAWQHQGEVVTATLPKMRAMSIGGLCIFLDIDRTTWIDYREKPAFSKICARVEEMIRDQKFSGAAADLLNASIIARDLGLAEKSETESKIDARIEYSITDEQAQRIAQALLDNDE